MWQLRFFLGWDHTCTTAAPLQGLGNHSSWVHGKREASNISPCRLSIEHDKGKNTSQYEVPSYPDGVWQISWEACTNFQTFSLQVFKIFEIRAKTYALSESVKKLVAGYVLKMVRHKPKHRFKPIARISWSLKPATKMKIWTIFKTYNRSSRMTGWHKFFISSYWLARYSTPNLLPELLCSKHWLPSGGLRQFEVRAKNLSLS